MKALIKYYLKSLFRREPYFLLLAAIGLYLSAESSSSHGMLLWMAIVFNYLSVSVVNIFSFQEMELSLPVSRDKLFFARLIVLWIVTLSGLIIIFIWREIMLNQQWNTGWLLINVVVLGLVYNATLLLFDRYIKVRPWKAIMLLVAVGVMIFFILTRVLASQFNVVTDRYLMLDFWALAAAVVLTFLAYRSYHNISLSPKAGVLTAAPTSQPTQITRTLPFSSLFFKIFRLRSAALRLVFSEIFANGLLLVMYIGFGYSFFLFFTAGQETILIFVMLFAFAVILGMAIHFSPMRVLNVFAFVPYPRLRLFRIAFFTASAPVVLIAVIGLGVYCNRINTFVEIPDNAVTDCSIGKEKDVSLDGIFNRYVNRGFGIKYRTPLVWPITISGRSCRVMDEIGYSRGCLLYTYKETLRYDPYSLSENDPASFAAYQISRYVRDLYGLSLSSDDVKNIANKWPGAEYKGHAGLAIKVINTYHQELTNALIKIIIGMASFFFTIFMWVGTISPDVWSYKSSNVNVSAFLVILLLLFVFVLSDYVAPLVYPLFSSAVMYFWWLLAACVFLSAAAYLITERRFNSLEVDNRFVINK